MGRRIYVVSKIKTHYREVIYIHPYTPMLDPLTLPLSLPALIRRIPNEVAGFSHSEIKDDYIRNAKIIIIDIHWHLSLLGAVELVRKIRRLNPKVKVVAGGITASEYAKILVDSFDIDYVIRGDAEIPLPSLVAALLNDQRNIKLVPNIVGKYGFETPWDYCLTQSDLDENEFYDINFFPTYKTRIINIHKRHKRWTPGAYPHLLSFRGCPLDCKSCAGGKVEQKKLFKRERVVRSPERFRSDLDTLAADPDIRFVTAINDFITLLPEHYSSAVLTKKFDLKLNYDFASAPALPMLNLLLKSFAGGVICFSCDKKHLTSSELNNPEHMIRLIAEVKRTGQYIPVLHYNGSFLAQDKEYRKWLKCVHKRAKPLLRDAASWWADYPQPDENGCAKSEYFYKFMNYNKTIKTLNLAMNKCLEGAAQMIDANLPAAFVMELRKFHIKIEDFLRAPSLYV
jgi:hypothetical protein